MPNRSETPSPSTFFAPAERAAPALIREQASALATCPLTQVLSNATLDIVLIINEFRQIVFASDNIYPLLPSKTEKLSDVLGLRPGEALGCVQAAIGPGGCGTSSACCECGAVHAILHGLGGRSMTSECRITRLIGGKRESMDLRVRSTPFVHEENQYTLLAIADIGHEKRRLALEDNFLRMLSGQIEQVSEQAAKLHQGIPDDYFWRDEMDALIQEIGEVRERVNDWRNLAAAENDHLVPSCLSFLACDFIKGLVKRFAVPALESGCWLRIDPASDNPELISDEDLVRRVLENLVRNALEASRPGEKITLGCRQKGPTVEFWVHNVSVMPENVRVQVFSRSFSTKAAGRGLGTYTARLLTERYLLGRIDFTSDEERGTVFTVSLPLDRLNADRPSTPDVTFGI